MNKAEALKILVLLSQLEGYIAGKLSTHVLPDYIAEELAEVCELLAEKISA
jgi:hypothetical protein